MTVLFPSYTKPSAIFADFTFNYISNPISFLVAPRLQPWTITGWWLNHCHHILIELPASALAHVQNMFTMSLRVIFMKCRSWYVSRECMFLGSLSPHNKNLEWQTLKPLGRTQLSEDRPCYSSQVSNGPCCSS